ncbi:MAG: LysM peptidoglycan-binding domain-containing protein [Bacteroidetes bacterium]|uniref:LysM peptidoglycan-binding domain-containing protein n=1 Tax=Candidatus Egerieousia excrementavium TaxID=2840778 RepID=A0A9D9DL37_9BACT|nr:LysM peptidoglycan-binding domain-containing protein [Candidatus Egerieousia excrementavium]
MTRKYSMILLLLAFLAAPAAANAQFLKKIFKKNGEANKKELKAQINRLERERDSLLTIIEGGAIALSDTTTMEDTLNVGELDYVTSQIFGNAEPGSNPDSLLSIWYRQKAIPIGRFISEPDSVEYFSNIPDSVYIRKIQEMNSFIPIPYNRTVRNYIILYTEKMPEFSEQILGLSQYYLPIFEEILDQYNLPKELKVMAIIESGLSPVARSRANAKGIWQFMFRTALQYDLKITSFVDERYDPIKATHAAAKYLSDAYTIFGDWALAISSYNCGAGNVNKAIRRAGSREFWDIYPYLPRETRGYVPAFVGALYLINYYKDYKLEPAKTSLPIEVDTFKIHRNLHFKQISELVGIPIETLKSLNPQYVNEIIPGNEKNEYILRVPYNYTAAFVDHEDSLYNFKKDVYFTPVVYNRIKEDRLLSESQTIYHKVRSGETLGGIALRYKVRLADLKRWNNIGSRNLIRIGQRLVIYKNGGAPASSSSGKAKVTSDGNYQYYTIKKGDTLLGIAYSCGVKLNDILKLNGLSRNSKIYPGKKLKIKKI